MEEDVIKESMLFMYFNGDCGAALDLYQRVFDAEVVERETYGEAKMTEIESAKQLIMNSTFRLGGLTFWPNVVRGTKYVA